MTAAKAAKYKVKVRGGKQVAEKLSALAVAKLSAPGLHADGKGLYLQISKTGSASWLYRFQVGEVKNWMGLGSRDDVGLLQARVLRDAARLDVKAGRNPIEARQERRDADAAMVAKAKAQGVPFEDCATAFIEEQRKGWKNAKHAAQWTNTIKQYANPVIGKLALPDITTEHIRKIMTTDDLWSKKHETATRLLDRLKRVFAYAKAKKLRDGDNPADLKGDLGHMLAKSKGIRENRPVMHHPAMPYSQLPTFMKELRAQAGIAAKALEFTILNVARTGDTIAATAQEFTDDAALWTIPAGRMKKKREHRVPMSAAAQIVYAQMREAYKGEFVFPGQKAKRPLSNMAMAALLKRMGQTEYVVHGFRSTFRDWAAEQTNAPSQIVEFCLAHGIKDKTVSAYYRTDVLDKRRKLLGQWATYCASVESGKVRSIGSAKKLAAATGSVRNVAP